MKKVTMLIDDYLYEFYQKIGKNTGGLPAEKVMADALFWLAGELSLHVISGEEKAGEFFKEKRAYQR